MNGNGFGPSPDYMAQINATLGGGPPPTAPVMLGARPPMPPPPMAPPPPEPNMSAMPPPAPPPMNLASTPAPQQPPPPSMPTPGPRPFLQQVGAAGIANVAAKETEMRGPQLKQAQGERNAAFEGAVQAVTERSERTAAGDYAIALDQARKAGVREDAANQTAAERNEELQMRQADFDQSVKALSQQSIDPGRFWANASTGQKIAALISTALGGFSGSGHNAGTEAINNVIDRDIKAQEFAYHAARDTMNAKQTAFSTAMQKYNNVDAARAAARAASLDAASAQMGQQAALWKGTEAANRAQMAMASLQDERMQQIAQGVMFSPARQVAVGASYVDPRTGMRYSEQEAKGLVGKMDEREFAREQKATDVAGQMFVEGAKAGAKGNEKADEGAKGISNQLQQAGVPQARAAAELALRALNASEGGKGEALFRATTPDVIGRTVASDKANAREQAYANFSNAAIKAMMGNATPQEVERAEAALGQASDPESRRRAIASTMDTLSEIEKNAKAGASPEAQAEFERRRTVANGAPAAAPKGSKAGW